MQAIRAMQATLVTPATHLALVDKISCAMSDNVNDVGVTVTFAPEASFDVEAIKRAAYRFSDRVSVEINNSAEGVACRLRPLNLKPPDNLDQLASEFRNEVLDQDLRLKIGVETEGYRNLILSLAFSKTPLGQ
jgi:His-Xaa-Ser system protein HxsD